MKVVFLFKYHGYCFYMTLLRSYDLILLILSFATNMALILSLNLIYFFGTTTDMALILSCNLILLILSFATNMSFILRFRRSYS